MVLMEEMGSKRKKVVDNGMVLHSRYWDSSISQEFYQVSHFVDQVNFEMWIEPNTKEDMIKEIQKTVDINRYQPVEVKTDETILKTQIIGNVKYGGNFSEAHETFTLLFECQPDTDTSTDVELMIEMEYFKDIGLFFKKYCSRGPAFSTLLFRLLKWAVFLGIFGVLFLFGVSYFLQSANSSENFFVDFLHMLFEKVYFGNFQIKRKFW